MAIVGGIEAGGTKFVCAVGSGPQDLVLTEILTTEPRETLQRVAEFFRAQQRTERIGIGSFGPIDTDPRSPTFGYITSTPKTAWRNFNLAGAVREMLGVEIAFDTDVNAAALAEFRWGAAQGVRDFVYLTVGTGIGGGGMMHGQLIHGRSHPEMGHMRVPHDLASDPFAGNCPYHGNCLEGLAAAPAIEARWGAAPLALPDGHQAWDLEAHYLALGIVNLALTLSPVRIILGGGVMRRTELYKTIREKTAALLHGYIAAPEIVPPGLGARAGVLGAMALASASQPQML